MEWREDVCRKFVPLVRNQTGFVRWFGINIYVTAFSVIVILLSSTKYSIPLGFQATYDKEFE